MQKKNTLLETGFFTLAVVCLLLSFFASNDATIVRLLVAATYSLTGCALLSKIVRFKPLVSTFVLVVWCLSTTMVIFAGIATALKPEWQLYTLWLGGSVIFLSAGQHVLLQRNY